MLRLLLLGSLALLVSCRVMPLNLNLHTHLTGLNFVPKSAPINMEAKCNLDKIKLCGEGFYKEIGYRGDPGNYIAFINYVYSNYISKGKDGFDKLCNAIADAGKCYGPGLIECLTPETFEALGQDKQTATSFAVFYQEIGYECGPGKKVMDKNFDCITKTDAASQQHYTDCANKFQGEIQKDPDHFCKYAQEYITCLSDPFKACGDDARNVVCSTIKAGLSQVFPCKDLTCKASASFAASLPSFSQIPEETPVIESDAKCDLDKIKTCGQAFYKKIGYTGDPGDFNAFSTYVYSKYYTQGAKGFDEFCGTISDFESCYGPGLIDCLSIANIRTMGADQETAANYAVFFHQQGYMCGPAKKVFDKKFECYGKATMDNQEYLGKCLSTFQAELQKDPQNMCKYAQEYTECYIKPFLTCGADLQNAVCGLFSSGFEPIGCKITCKAPRSFPVLPSFSKVPLNTDAIQNEAQCNIEKIKTCGEAFYKEIGYHGDPGDFHDFTLYVYSRFYGAGVKGFDKFCSAVSDFEKCFGSGLIQCLTIENLVQLGLDQGAAASFSVFSFTNKVTCAELARKVFLMDEKFDCYVKQSIASEQHEKECLDKFLKEIQSDPHNMCKYAQEYTDCYIEPFSACGSDLQNTACRMMAAGFVPIGCDTKCKA